MPVEVYHNQRPMIEVSLSSDSIEMRVDVCQYCLDIEPWLVSAMDDVFTDTVAASFSSLNDYEMEIVDVSFIQEERERLTWGNFLLFLPFFPLGVSE